MRIENNSNENVARNGSSGPVQNSQLQAASAAAGAGAGRPGDLVSLSGQWNLVAMAKSMAAADRSAKVANLAAQVESGTYQPHPDEVSESVIRDHLRG